MSYELDRNFAIKNQFSHICRGRITKRQELHIHPIEMKFLRVINGYERQDDKICRYEKRTKLKI